MSKPNNENDLISFVKFDDPDLAWLQILWSRLLISQTIIIQNNFFLFGIENFNFKVTNQRQVFFQEMKKDAGASAPRRSFLDGEWPLMLLSSLILLQLISNGYAINCTNLNFCRSNGQNEIFQESGQV